MIGAAADALSARRAAPVRRLLAEELRDRRSRDQRGEDLLGAMLTAEPEQTDDAIVDELLIVLMAAQEPPGIALANVVHELGRRPEVAEQFRADPEHHRAIVCEAIRLRPSATAALRTLTEPMTIESYHLRAGTAVAAASLLLHRDPQAFPEPDVFRADRFAGITPANQGGEGGLQRLPFIPFGAAAHAGALARPSPRPSSELSCRRSWAG